MKLLRVQKNLSSAWWRKTFTSQEYDFHGNNSKWILDNGNENMTSHVLESDRIAWKKREKRIIFHDEWPEKIPWIFSNFRPMFHKLLSLSWLSEFSIKNH